MNHEQLMKALGRCIDFLDHPKKLSVRVRREMQDVIKQAMAELDEEVEG